MRWPLALPGRAGSLRLLVMAVSDRCDQRCAHCAIWEGPGRPGLSLEERQRVAGEAIGLGVREVLFTGGEPLLSRDLWPLAERFARAGVRVLLASNGRRLAANADRVAALVDEVYLSLDGAAPESHDRLRGAGSFAALAEGVAALRARAPRRLLVARSTLHAANLGEFPALAEAARRLGFDHVSFLPLDAVSSAFGGHPEARAALLPCEDQLAGFERAIGALEEDGGFLDGFILEPAAKLRRLARHLRASAGGGRFEPPPCDAPWWSSVVEHDGAVRPCFFQAPAGDARLGLAAARSGRPYRDALARVRAGNPVCGRCVCPKRRGIPLAERLLA